MEKTLEGRIKKHRDRSRLFFCISALGTAIWVWLDLNIPLWCHLFIYAALLACLVLGIWNFVISDKLKRGNMR